MQSEHQRSRSRSPERSPDQSDASDNNHQSDSSDHDSQDENEAVERETGDIFKEKVNHHLFTNIQVHMRV